MYLHWAKVSASLVAVAVSSQPKCGDGGGSAFQRRPPSATVAEMIVHDRGRGDKGAGQKEGPMPKNGSRAEARNDYVSIPGDGGRCCSIEPTRPVRKSRERKRNVGQSHCQCLRNKLHQLVLHEKK